MTIWYDQRAGIIRAVAHGAGAAGAFGDPTIGPVTWDRIDYPHAEVLPEESTRDAGNDWRHTVRLNCYFQRNRPRSGRSEGDDYLTWLEATLEATAGALENLAADAAVQTYVPQRIEDFAGTSPDGDSLVLISVQLVATTSVDLADV